MLKTDCLGAILMRTRLVSVARGEQQYFDPDGIPTQATGTISNPYLAYPDLLRPYSPTNLSTSTLESYDFVEDEDISAALSDGLDSEEVCQIYIFYQVFNTIPA